MGLHLTRPCGLIPVAFCESLLRVGRAAGQVSLMVPQRRPMSRTLDTFDSNQLADVLALIQVLGVGDSPNRTERALRDEIFLGPPRSADTWAAVASQHPEFFRVSGEGKDNIRLSARHAAGNNDSDRKLSTEFVQRLMQTAVDIHDREAKRRERWTLYLPLLIAVIGAAGSVATALIAVLLSKG